MSLPCPAGGFGATYSDELAINIFEFSIFFAASLVKTNMTSPTKRYEEGCELIADVIQRVGNLVQQRVSPESSLHKYKIRRVSKTIVTHAISNFLPSKFIPKFVPEVVSNVTSCVEVEFSVSGSSVTALFAEASRPLCSPSHRDIILFVWIVNTLLPLLQTHFSCKIKQLNVVMFLCDDQRKIMPHAGEHTWGPDHVNTGVSLVHMHTHVGNDILVYRREEWFKVLIHELIHCHGADAYMHKFYESFPYIDDTISKSLGIIEDITAGPSRGVLLGEAYVDAFAICIHAACVAGLRCFHEGTSSLGGYRRELDYCVNTTLEHVTNVCAAVCCRLGFILDNTQRNVVVPPVFSYYIGKCALLLSDDAMRDVPQRGIRSDKDAWAFINVLMSSLTERKCARTITSRMCKSDSISLRMSGQLLKGTAWEGTED